MFDGQTNRDYVVQTTVLTVKRVTCVYTSEPGAVRHVKTWAYVCNQTGQWQWKHVSNLAVAWVQQASIKILEWSSTEIGS